MAIWLTAVACSGNATPGPEPALEPEPPQVPLFKPAHALVLRGETLSLSRGLRKTLCVGCGVSPSNRTALCHMYSGHTSAIQTVPKAEPGFV